jgi:hypothetical protein
MPAILTMTFAAGAVSPAAAERPLLRSGSETSVPGEIRPALPLARFIIGSLDRDDVRILDECIAGNGVTPHAYEALLLAVRIPSAAGRRLWFVRPSHTASCLPLYGAHLFRYFLVEERAGRYRMSFQGGGDVFAVYPRLSHGLNDIETTGCNARECWTARWVYNGTRYRPGWCTREWLDGSRPARRLRCPASNIPFQFN